MENKVFRNVISALVIAVMAASVCAIPILSSDAYADDKGDQKLGSAVSAEKAIAPKMAVDFQSNGKQVAAGPQANYKKNIVKIPSNMKSGKTYTFKFNGDRHANIVSKFEKGQTFYEGETYYVPQSLTLKKPYGTDKRTFPNQLASTPYKSYPLDFYAGSGKFTLTTNFKKWTVDGSGYFKATSESPKAKVQTFYVKSKIKYTILPGGKSTKSYKKAVKKYKYKTPTKKYGKLPKPKAKKGYKFKGWYTYKDKKVKKSTKVPNGQSTIYLYAKFKRK